MKANGDGDKQIWMTEFGWAEAVGPGFTVLCDQGVDKGKKNGGVTRDEQAAFLKQAFACMAPDPFVKMASWFTLNDPGDYRTGVHGYGLIDWLGNERPILGAMQTVGNGAGAGSNPNCGGKVDHDPPAATINVPDVYFNRLRIQGSATDPTTPVNKMEMWVDGKRVEGVNQDGGKYDYDWFGSTKLAYGKHTVELRAYDEANNVGKASKVVTKVNPTTQARTVAPRVAFKARKKGRKILVTGRVLRALAGDFTEEPNGGVRIVFEWKRKKKFVQMYRTQKNVSRPIRVTFKPTRPGTWRVRGILRVDAPYKNVRTKKYVVKVRR
jgi:hypothetical protein